MNRPTVLTPSDGVRIDRRARDRAADRASPELRLKRGKVLVVAGWIVAVVGVVVYSVACFAAESDADLAGIVLRGTIPAARAGLAVVGAGTLMWLVGSIMHLGAVLDAGGDEP